MAGIKLCLILVALFVATSVFSQDYIYAYLVEFTDKANSSYSVDKPGEFLTERALARRAKFNIEITEQDIPVNKSYTDSLQQFGAQLHVTSRWLNSAVFYTNFTSFENDALTCSFVKSVKKVYDTSSLKNKSLIHKWQTDISPENYGAAYGQVAMCNVQKLHRLGFTGKGIQIAVLDGGFYHENVIPGFDSLNLNHQILGHWDFVSHNDNVFDDDSHGMSVLSIMGGNVHNEFLGIAPKASYYLFRTENVNSEFPIEEENWIAGAERADSLGADIITASLGYSVFDNSAMDHTYADMDGKSCRITRGAEIAFSKGMMVVNSAGNEGRSSWLHIVAPSDGEHVLCVGAVDSNRNLAGFSSLGPSSDGRTKPDLCAQGVATAIIRSGGKVSSGNGTSFSCPVMTGMVACLWQAFPDYSNQQILDLMRSIGDRFYNPDNSYGYGIPDLSKVIFKLDSIAFEMPGSDKIDKIYPNPLVNEVSLNYFSANNEEVIISLIDFFGNKIYTETRNFKANSYNNIKIEGLAKLSKGYYLVTLNNGNKIISEKLAKFRDE